MKKRCQFGCFHQKDPALNSIERCGPNVSYESHILVGFGMSIGRLSNAFSAPWSESSPELDSFRRAMAQRAESYEQGWETPFSMDWLNSHRFYEWKDRSGREGFIPEPEARNQLQFLVYIVAPFSLLSGVAGLKGESA